MPPVVRLNDPTFEDLSTLRTWFGTKTPSETIEKIVKEKMQELGMERDIEPGSAVATTSDGAMELETAPGLSFTKPLSATINGRAIENPRWSTLLLTMIAQLKAKGLDGDKLVRELQIPAKVQRYEKEGFRYHTRLGISVQGQSAAEAWKEIDRIAKKWSIPVKVEFSWRQNPKAQYPGKTAILRCGTV